MIKQVPGPSFGVSCLEVPDGGGLGRNQPGDPDMKVLVPDSLKETRACMVCV